MEENNDTFLAGGDALIGQTNAQKNIPQHLFGIIHLICTHLE